MGNYVVEREWARARVCTSSWLFMTKHMQCSKKEREREHEIGEGCTPWVIFMSGSPFGIRDSERIFSIRKLIVLKKLIFIKA